MADYTKNARSVINSFLWNELIKNNILRENDYRPDGSTKSIVPIIPSQQIPEFNNLLPEETYIIYDYELDGYSEDWWVCYERVIYTIVSPHYAKIIEVLEFMIDIFRRKDISGKELQSQNSESDILKFYSTCVDSVSSPEPIDTEGGRTYATIEVSYKYSRILGDEGRFS